MKKQKKNSKQQNNNKTSLLTGHHHKPLSYRVTIFLMKYAHLHKLGFEPPTSSLARTFLITTLVTVQGMLLFYINSEIDLQGRVTPSPVHRNDLQGRVMPPPVPKNIFLFYLKIYLIAYIQKNKLKNMKLLHYGYCELYKH